MTKLGQNFRDWVLWFIPLYLQESSQNTAEYLPLFCFKLLPAFLKPMIPWHETWSLGTSWCLPSQTRWDWVTVLWSAIPFLHLILFCNYKYCLFSSFPSSLVLRRKGCSIGFNQAIRKSVDFPALGEHDCGLGVLLILNRHKCKTNKKKPEVEINSSQMFQQKFKELITKQKINLFINFRSPLNKPKFWWV